MSLELLMISGDSYCYSGIGNSYVRNALDVTINQDPVCQEFYKCWIFVSMCSFPNINWTRDLISFLEDRIWITVRLYLNNCQRHSNFNKVFPQKFLTTRNTPQLRCWSDTTLVQNTDITYLQLVHWIYGKCLTCSVRRWRWTKKMSGPQRSPWARTSQKEENGAESWTSSCPWFPMPWVWETSGGSHTCATVMVEVW